MARILGAVAVTLFLAGCLSPTERSNDDTPQATAAPLSAADAASAAPDLLTNAGLTLPTDATGIEVDLITYQEFREVSVTRFTTSPAAAEVACTDAGGRPLERSEGHNVGYEKDMLGDFVMEPGMLACRIGADAKGVAVVFISPDDPARVTVLAYRLPSR